MNEEDFRRIIREELAALKPRRVSLPNKSAVKARHAEWVDLVVNNGKRPVDVAKSYGVSRAAVAFVCARAGWKSPSRDPTIKAQKEAARKAAKDSKMLGCLGINRAQWAMLVNEPYSSKHPLRVAFVGFYNNSTRHSGMPVRITFAQWFALWMNSGHMHERGNGGWGVSRIDTSRPFEISNVCIEHSFDRASRNTFTPNNQPRV